MDNRWFAVSNSNYKGNNAGMISCRPRELYGIIYAWYCKVPFDLYFDFIFDCSLAGQGDFRFFFWLCLHIKWFVRGRLVFNLNIILRECFFRTRIARITRILQVCDTCSIKDKILDGLNHSSRKRSRLQIRLESLCIKKGKVKKNPWSKTPCASVISVSFFDLRSVAAGSQDELQQDFSQFIFL